jgi:peptide-methionine (S)-S-oxide reductase
MKSQSNMENNVQPEEIAYLAGGCFWCLEVIYDELKGVKDVISGYSGGELPNPTYRQVISGNTGHAETVKVVYDPDQVNYHEIMQVFFSIHDPTSLNRQGADVGTQYRSAIFYTSPEQKAAAEEIIRKLEKEQVWGEPIVTEVVPFEAFYPAEDYHQEYYKNNTGQPYCQIVINPKLTKFRREFVEGLKRQD